MCTDPWGHFYALCLHAADERAVFGVHDERVAGVQVAGEDGAGNERLGVALQVALERTRTVDRVIPCLLYTSDAADEL